MSDREGLGPSWALLNVMHTVRLGNTKLLEQHELKSSTRENNAIKRRSQHKKDEAAASGRHTVLHQFFFYK